MELFDKKFMYLEWDDVLEGKEVFLADSLVVLKRAVMLNEDRLSVEENDGDYPFTSPAGVHYSMAYYDPNYECKVAWKQGKQIQYQSHYSFEWQDCDDPKWSEYYEYRVKPEKKWRPFKDIQELKNVWSDKAGMSVDYKEPLIWVRDKERPDITRLITDFNGGCKSVALAGNWHILEALFDDYTFLDGTPCGVLESVEEEVEE